jgi:hypothetical protein
MKARHGLGPLVVAALPLAIVACGGSHGSNPGGSDGSAPLDGASSFDGAIPAPGTATLVGPQAFPVGSAQTGSALTGGCGGSDDAGLAAQLSIVIGAQDLPAVLCGDGGVPDAGSGGWIDIEIATTQAIEGTPITQALAPGVYVIGNEGEDDPDVCMLPSGSNAFLQLLTPGADDATATAISGTVTLDSVTASAVTGTFSVLMGGPFGTTDASPPPALSGAFNATACP